MESEKLDEVTLDFIRFGLRSQMPKGVYPLKLEMDRYRDYLHGWVVHEISWMLLGKKIETRKYPATWWDAFKNRWYPKFLKNRFPVNWAHFNLYNICPHINHDFQINQSIHFDWLANTKDFQSLETRTRNKT